MLDDTKHQERLRRNSHPDEHAASSPKKEAEAEGVEASCGAFGYLRGIRDQSAAVEFRFRDGNSIWFPYSWLGNWQYNPSEGLLLKFSGDLVYLVLIRGSNLDRPLNEGSDQSHPCRPATASGALGTRDERRGEPASRRERADHRQHRGGGVRDPLRPQGMAGQARPGVRVASDVVDRRQRPRPEQHHLPRRDMQIAREGLFS